MTVLFCLRLHAALTINKNCSFFDFPVLEKRNFNQERMNLYHFFSIKFKTKMKLKISENL